MTKEGVNWRVEFSRRAERDIRRLIKALGKERAGKILGKLMEILRDPLKNRWRFEKIKGSKEGILKTRIEKFRAAFLLDEKERIVKVLSLGFRESFYEKL